MFGGARGRPTDSTLFLPFFLTTHDCRRLGFSMDQHVRDIWQDVGLLGHGSGWIVVAARKTPKKIRGAVGSPVAHGLSTGNR